MRFQHGCAMYFGLGVAEMADLRFQRGCAILFGILMVSEMAEYAISARMRSVFWHSVGCGDGGICDFTKVPQCVGAF